MPGSISGPVTNVCYKDDQKYSIAAVAGATSYTWTAPAGVTILKNYGTYIEVKFTSIFIGTGNITVKANNSCGSSAVRSLSVTALTSPPGTIAGSSSVCKTNASIPYSITAVTGGTSYSWTITGGAKFVGPTSGTSVIVKYTTALSNSATLSVKANNGCGLSVASSKKIAVDLNCRTTESETSDASANLNVYPNPAHDKVTVSIEIKESANYCMKLLDVSGRAVISENHNAVAGLNLYNLNLSGLSKGVYVLELTSVHDNCKSKVVVE